MSEIDWDLAPEGAVAIKQDCGHWKNVTWVNDKGEWWDDNDALWCVDVTNNWVQTIAVRPVTQQKTVADAYEYCDGVWPDDQDNYIYYFCVEGKFNSRNCDWEDSKRSYKVCTREQFEAYAKEQEDKQEGEKWTHKVYGDKCRIKESEPDRDGYIIVVTESGGYHLCTPDELKPIKPTLTKAEAWDRLLEDARHHKNYGLTLRMINERYDII